MDLVFVACHLITQLAVKTHQLPIGSNQLRRHIAPTSFDTSQHTGNGSGIQLIRFGSQAARLQQTDGFDEDAAGTTDTPGLLERERDFPHSVKWPQDR